MKKRAFVFAIGGVIVAIAPILSLALAASFSHFLGCRLDEAGTYPCPVFGLDIGGLLSIMSLAGWLTFISVPVGLLMIALGAIFLAIWLTNRKKKLAQQGQILK